MKKRLVFWFSFLILYSCDSDFFSPVIDVELPEIDPKLVVYGHLEEGSDTLHILITSSRKILDDRPFPFVSIDTIRNPFDSSRLFIHAVYGSDTVHDVHVELYRNNVLLTSFQKHKSISGIYSAFLNQPLMYEAGVNYTLKASAPGFESVESTASIPRPVKIDTVNFRLNTRVADPSDPSSLFEVNEYSLSFTDPPLENDYYTCSAYYFDTANSGFLQPTYIQSFDFKSQFNFLSDASFNGKLITWNVHENVNHSGYTKFMQFNLHHVSQSLYLYTLSERRYEDAKDNPFAEPVILYTNIKNGYGVFSMGSTRKYQIRVR